MMNELWYAVFGAILSVFFGVIFSEPIKNYLTPILAKFGQKNNGITGKWVATFEYPTSNGIDLYPEVIELSSFFGQIIGRIIPHEENHPRLKEAAINKPLRLIGELRDNLFFTGTWLHPLDRQHYHGAFQLVVRMTGDKMDGTWVGYSDDKKIIEQGNWIWKRI